MSQRHRPSSKSRHLVHKYGRTEAVNDLSLRVRRGQCYGFFGRNGAGKTTTIKCLLNLLRPASGSVRVFGLDPARDEVAVKSRLAYVPDYVAFYPWMTVRNVLDYLASFRPRWNRRTEARAARAVPAGPDAKKASALSRGQKTQLALTAAICAEPELLVLDEPTSGLDPIVRREFIQTVIGAYQEADPGNRTVFVSTHLISEFEGLIDEFTIIENGRAAADAGGGRSARRATREIRARFPAAAPAVEFPGGQAYPARGPGAGADRERPLGRDPATAPSPGSGGANDRGPDAGRDLRGGIEVRGGAMNARLIKETRDLLPIFAGTLLLIVVPYLHLAARRIRHIFALGVACVVMAGSSFGNEFQHRTLSLLLSQPIARSVLWRDKMLVLGAGMLIEPGRVVWSAWRCIPSSRDSAQSHGWRWPYPSVRLLRSTLSGRCCCGTASAEWYSRWLLQCVILAGERARDRAVGR